MRVGNNGGDGLVVARKIYSNGGKVTVFNLGDRLKYKGAAKQNFGIVEKIKIETINLQEISAVRDAVEVKYFPIHETPVLAFKSNAEAINTFIKAKSEFWAIIDSFYLSVSSSDIIEHQPNFLSDILVEVIEKNAELISDHWVKDVIINKTTPSYNLLSPEELSQRFNDDAMQYIKWLTGNYNYKKMKTYYRTLGAVRKKRAIL